MFNLIFDLLLQYSDMFQMGFSTTDYQMTVSLMSSRRDSVANTLNTETTQRCEYRLFLPECGLLDFIINTNFTMSLEYYYKLYGVVPMLDNYKGNIQLTQSVLQ